MFQSLSLLTITALIASTSAAAIVKRDPNVCPPKQPLVNGAPTNGASKPQSFDTITSIPVSGPAGANGFTVLASTGVSCVPEVTIHGNLGVAPVPISYVTGFSLTKFADYATSNYVVYPTGTGKLFGADTADSKSPTAVDAMGLVYSQAKGMVTDYSECHSGVLDNLKMVPGVYEWSTSVGLGYKQIVTLKGTSSATEYFILKSAGAFNFAAESKIILDGVTPDQVFFVAATSLTVAAGAQFQGIALTYTNIVIADNAIVKGRLLSQTEIALAKGSFVYLPSDTVTIA